jgi:mannose-1-phosphate guanylyltransferase
LLRDTYDRIRGLSDDVYVVTELRQREIIESVLPEIDSKHLIIEPTARGTTNAYGLAALTVAEQHPDAVMLAMASDHVVRGRAEVTKAVRAAASRPGRHPPRRALHRETRPAHGQEVPQGGRLLLEPGVVCLEGPSLPR